MPIAQPTPSITTWQRLEPRTRNADMNAGLQARVYDPLWLLARQWQVGEFQGEDNGSPASARWEGESARFTRYHPGALPDGDSAAGEVFDGDTMPLETLVERERVRPAVERPERLRFAVEAGQQFLRMLDQQVLSRSYRDAFKSNYPFAPLTAEQRDALDADSASFFALLAPRVPDGRRLYAALSTALRPAPPSRPALPRELRVVPADAAEVRVAAESWMQWYETLISEPAAAQPAWSAERMEYGFSIATRMSAGEKVLTAREYYTGRVDWHDFNVHGGATLGAQRDASGGDLTRTVMPTPVTYRGMPAPRFWEFEDALVDFGAVKAGPEDLARMLLVEFAITYGNDWFLIPVELPVGSLCRTRSLVVTNTFGERFLIQSASQPGRRRSPWRMFQLSSMPRPGGPPRVEDADADLFLLPPALVNTLEGRPVEEVLFLRDEMANMAWGVERVIESAVERPLDRYERQRYAVTTPVGQAEGKLRYRLATEVPDNWIPLLPVRRGDGLRLVRGRMLKADGFREVVSARGRVLNPGPPAPAGLEIFEEEIPREGIRVTRSYQLARWHDGSTHLWVGRRKEVGRGEGSSALRFDTLEP